jgi:hypothetical protein
MSGRSTTRPRRQALLLAGLALLAGIGAADARPERPREAVLTAPWGRVHLEIAKEQMGEGDAVVRCRVTDAPGRWPADALSLHYQAGGEWRRVPFWPARELGETPAAAGERLEAVIPNAGRGVQVRYYLEVADGASPRRLPASAPADAYALTFKGRPSTPLIAAHVVCMMGGLIPLLLAAVLALVFLFRGRALVAVRRLTLAGFALLFVGSVPLGIAVEYQVFGTYWEGWPFGRDVTDTKSGAILLLWLILLLVRGRDLWSRVPAQRGPSDRAWARWLIAITVFTVAMYLIPHENIKF